VIQRKSPRFAVQLPIRFADDTADTGGTILNISHDGCMITANRTPDTATYLRLDLHLREGEPPVKVSLAAVRWSSKSQFGLEYIKVGSEERERLKHFMNMLEQSPGF
jgi:hypothetical protein